MTQRQQYLFLVSWPVVVLCLIFFSSITGMYWVSTPDGRTALIGLVMAVSTGIQTVITSRIGAKVDEIRKDMRGARDDGGDSL